MTIRFMLCGLLFCGGSLFTGCTRNERIAGATSETTNGDLVASITTSSGAPAARVRVLVVEEEDWVGKVAEGSSIIMDTLRTDAAGGLTVHGALAHRCNLQIDNDSEGLFIRNVNTLFDTNKVKSVRKYSLAAYGGLSGHVHADFGSVRELRLAGTAYIAGVGADSAYAFTGVPAGTFTIVALANNGGSIEPFLTHSFDVVGGGQLVNQDLGVTANRILVDDFEQGWKQTAIGRILGGGLWYTATDIEEKGNSSVKVDLSTDSLAHAGSSIRAEFVLGNRLAFPWSVIGFRIGQETNNEVFDFSNLTAFTFWAKGQGTVDVRFMSLILTRETKDTAQYFFPVKLSPTWTLITIPVDSLRLPAPAQQGLQAFPWSVVAKEMQAVDFTIETPTTAVGDTTVLWLDDLYFEGISLKDIAP